MTIGFLKDMKLLEGPKLGNLIGPFRFADVLTANGKSSDERNSKADKEEEEEEDLSSLDEL